MIKNVDVSPETINELQIMADTEKRPLKLQMEFILENVAKLNQSKRLRTRPQQSIDPLANKYPQNNTK
jgi:hypothetical protein